MTTTTAALPSHPPPPTMDLQYILSPLQHPPAPHPPLVFQDKHQLGPPPNPNPEPSSSRTSPPLLHHHVHPNPDDAIINFDSKTRSFPKPTKSSAPAAADPYAEHFLRDMLGPEKWSTFSTRLFERRLGGKAKGKAKQVDDASPDDPKSGASAVEFLVKVEVVKSILRECVPHPYNPRKSLSHPYPPAPSGHVTLTRSTVLLLCGWSNTQFSYWARRAEALSVLAPHDPRLRAVAVALEHRLAGAPPAPPSPDDPGTAVTGKGLDLIIDDVKKRTGKSQFLRGKHSSLDPFGTAPPDPTAPPPPPQYAMPTFQAERYDHGAPPPPHSREVSASAASASASASASPSVASPPRPSPSHQLSSLHSPRATRASTRRAAVATDDDENPHHFPVSDSRSEATAASRKRKASQPHDDPPSPKRTRTDGETSSP